MPHTVVADADDDLAAEVPEKDVARAPGPAWRTTLSRALPTAPSTSAPMRAGTVTASRGC